MHDDLSFPLGNSAGAGKCMPQSKGMSDFNLQLQSETNK